MDKDDAAAADAAAAAAATFTFLDMREFDAVVRQERALPEQRNRHCRPSSKDICEIISA